ncbi:MAG: DGQHR domain-containing protein [Verrucomicrobiota bacterium]|nr:DGQHR domain-containing protein [Limisphaera sp.]MDW8382596.1 DGQHR domain-containing protein [Verrucomicrobiota bacterium]
MIATQVRQKDATFYFVNYPADDLLRHVRFITRFHAEEGFIESEAIDPNDEVARFIAGIEKSDQAFQRRLARRKVIAIKNFYEAAVSQPPIPGTILLFTPEQLNFTPLRDLPGVGNLETPLQKYLIIDGQHRLAALHFYAKAHPEEARTIEVPCIIFDGRSEDFAAEMFVIINSTPTRINKSHLVDLYEKISWEAPDRRLAAKVVDLLYREASSPLRYRINRLGGRSHKDKWILQAELFNEIHRWIQNQPEPPTVSKAERYFRILCDFFTAAKSAWAEAWGHPKYMVTRPVTLKAMVRVCAQLVAAEGDPADGERFSRWHTRLRPWNLLINDFRADGFYQRFPAKGEVERVSVIQRELARHIGLTQAQTRRKRAH